MKPLVYVAGPYSHPDPVINVPHLSMLWHTIKPHPVEFWYAYDLEVLARCDAVFRIQGNSEGADGEVKEAERLGRPVFGPYVDAEFRAWVRSFSQSE